MSPPLVVSVRVPASTSNLGCGFDVFGLALSFSNELHLGPSPDGRWSVEIRGEGATTLPRDRKNLVIGALRSAGTRFGVRFMPMRITMVNRIPLARGLGSSAAAATAGVAAAAFLSPRRPSFDRILSEIARIEGHPDNAAAALLGGFVASYRAGSSFVPRRLPLHSGLRVALAIPDFGLQTKRARAILPHRVPLEDAVFNLSRTALLPEALRTGRYGDLSDLLDDRLHQDRRAHLIPGMRQALRAAPKSGAFGAFLSGGGSSTAAFAPPSRAQAVALAMCRGFESSGRSARPLVLRPDLRGAQVRFGRSPWRPIHSALAHIT